MNFPNSQQKKRRSESDQDDNEDHLNNDDNDNNMQEGIDRKGPPSLIQDFLNRLNAHNPDRPDRQRQRQQHNLDEIQVRYLLEATGGDIDLALGLYWEDSVARAMKDDNKVIGGAGPSGDIAVADNAGVYNACAGIGIGAGAAASGSSSASASEIGNASVSAGTAASSAAERSRSSAARTNLKIDVNAPEQDQYQKNDRSHEDIPAAESSLKSADALVSTSTSTSASASASASASIKVNVAAAKPFSSSSRSSRSERKSASHARMRDLYMPDDEIDPAGMDQESRHNWAIAIMKRHSRHSRRSLPAMNPQPQPQPPQQAIPPPPPPPPLAVGAGVGPVAVGAASIETASVSDDEAAAERLLQRLQDSQRRRSRKSACVAYLTDRGGRKKRKIRWLKLDEDSKLESGEGLARGENSKSQKRSQGGKKDTISKKDLQLIKMLCDKANPSVGKANKFKDQHTIHSPSTAEKKQKEDLETKSNNNTRARYNAVDSSDADYDYYLDIDNSTSGLTSPSPLLWGGICEPPSTSSPLSVTNTEDDGEEENEQRDRCEEKGNDKNDDDDDEDDEEEEEDKSIVNSTENKFCYWNDDDSSLSDLPPAGSSPGRNAAARRRCALRERLKHSLKRDGKMEGKGPQCSSNKDFDENEDGNSSGTDNTTSINDSNSKHKDNAKCVIPRTWLSAGFNLSPCGMGLVLNSPIDSELARLKSMQRSDSTANTMASNNNSNSNGNPAIPSSSGTSVKIKPPLPPYHCGAITALLSIVTALIYSGASIQGREVNCNSVRRRPFASLSLEDRKKEFPTRLVEALSALLYVAAREVTEKRGEVLNTLFCQHRKRKISKTISSGKSSSCTMERKVNNNKIVSWPQKKSGKKSLNGDDVVLVTEYDGLEGTSKKEEITGGVDGSSNINEEWDDIPRGQEDHDYSNDEDMEDDNLEDKELMTRRRWRAKLCRVCRWEKGETAGEFKIPLDQLIDRDSELKIMLSLTNLDDIKSFVLSNLRTFMSPGGCALFLETIIHIHGIPIVTKMIRKSKGLSPNEKVSPLSACLCEERQRNKWIKLLQKQQQDAKATPLPQSKKLCVDDELPQGHACMGIELLSLLLTGKVHSSLTGWNAHKLGIGLLSVDGDSTTGNGGSTSRLKFPPKPIWIVRGDTCYSLLWKNDLKVPGSRSCSLADEEADSLVLTHWNCWYGVSNKTEMRVVPSVRGKLNVLRPVLGNRTTIEKGLSNSMTTGDNHVWKDKENETNHLISAEEIDNTESHPEDERYYPKNYRRWRFRFNFAADQEATSQKLPAWTAFFRLTERQKKIVEQKLSPRINMAIWSKWPGATVDNIVPQGVSPPVV